nr:hypothetical protein [Bacteroidota bacterium]
MNHIFNVENFKENIAKSNLVDLDRGLIIQIQQAVQKVSDSNSQTEQSAKEIISNWFSKLLLSRKDFDINSLKLEITNQPIIHFQSQYHCETRDIVKGHEAYTGQV